jgi:hypothetical protein
MLGRCEGERKARSRSGPAQSPRQRQEPQAEQESRPGCNRAGDFEIGGEVTEEPRDVCQCCEGQAAGSGPGDPVGGRVRFPLGRVNRCLLGFMRFPGHQDQVLGADGLPPAVGRRQLMSVDAGEMKTGLPAPEDYFRLTHARELRRVSGFLCRASHALYGLAAVNLALLITAGSVTWRPWTLPAELLGHWGITGCDGPLCSDPALVVRALALPASILLAVLACFFGIGADVCRIQGSELQAQHQARYGSLPSVEGT